MRRESKEKRDAVDHIGPNADLVDGEFLFPIQRRRIYPKGFAFFGEIALVAGFTATARPLLGERL